MKLVLRSIVFLIFCGTSMNLYSQNIVSNGSFESGDANYPTAAGQIGHLNSWYNFESSDWYSSMPGLLQGFFDPTGLTNGFGGSGVMSAHTGDKFIGFGPCEGVQGQLTSQTGINDVVKVSFWWSPRTKVDSEINMYLLKNAANSSVALADCFNPNLSFEFSSKVTVNANGADAIHIPGQWYYFESESILMEDDNYSWFAIKGSNVSGTLFSNEYIYVDDIAISSINKCQHICRPKENIHFSMIQGQPNVLVNAIIGNVQNWAMLVENATNIVFRVFSNASQEFYTYEAFDPSGLKDPGHNDYAFAWNGEDNNGNPVQFGFYNFTLEISNCTSNMTTLGFPINGIYPLLIFPAVNPIHNPPFQSKIMRNCCVPNATYNNITFQNGFRKDVDDFINAGTGGPTIVPAFATVKFFAGNNITLGPGFQAIGNFIGEIVPCGTFSQKMASREGFLMSQNAMDSLSVLGEEKLNTQTQFSFDIYPNPNKGVFNVQINNEEPALIEVYDVMGKVVFNQRRIRENTSIDISNQPKGVYFVKITIGDSVFNEKIIYQ